MTDNQIASEENRTVTFKKISIRTPVIQIQIKHKSSDGEITERPITIEKIRAFSPRNTLVILTIDAFCHMTEARREFKITGIQEAFDGESGEALWDLVGWLFLVIGQGRKIRFPKEMNNPPPDKS